MKKIGVLLIATGKYHQFVRPLIKNIYDYFMPGHKVTAYVFTDNNDLLDEFLATPRVNVVTKKIDSLKYPYATLYRYKVFTENADLLKDEDYLFYMDVDMAIVKEVSGSILPYEGLVAVFHPGFYGKGGWGSSNNPENSTSYLPPEKRKNYYAGGFQGGSRETYLKVAKLLHENIQKDEMNGVMAEWHDETHWNWFLNNGSFSDIISLTPEYCMVEQAHLRKEWKIDDIDPRIIALAKNHAELRS